MSPELTVHDGVTADEVLYVLAGCETVLLNRISFVVITGVYAPRRLEPQEWRFTPGEILAISSQTVAGQLDTTGEIITGRDPFTSWEDSQWCVYYAPHLDAALAVAELVRSGRPRGYYGWTADGLSYAGDQAAAERRWCSTGGEDPVRIGDFTGRRFCAESKSREQDERLETDDPA